MKFLANKFKITVRIIKEITKLIRLRKLLFLFPRIHHEIIMNNFDPQIIGLIGNYFLILIIRFLIIIKETIVLIIIESVCITFLSIF
jgi:hypothetical protein